MLPACPSLSEMTTDTALLEELYETYAPKILGLATHILHHKADAEDALVEVFIKVMKYQEDFVHLTGDETWRLLVIYTRSTCYDLLRKRHHILSHFVFPTEPSHAQEIASAENVEKDHLRQELVQNIQAWIDRLPSPAREIMLLKYFFDLPNTKISTITGVNPSTVSTIIQRQTAKIRKAFEEEWK